MQLNWVFVMMVAIVTIGFIQWAKALLKSMPRKEGAAGPPSWIWAIIMPIFSVLVSYLFTVLPEWVAYGALAFAMAQLGYDNIIQFVQKKIERI